MKLGIALPDLGFSQLTYFAVKSLNEAVSPDFDVIAFYEGLRPMPLPPRFAAMQMAEAWGFDGVLLATTLSTAEKILRCPSAKKRFFYVWDLEWLRPSRKEYRAFQAIYGDPRMELIARCPDHAAAIEAAWNRRPVVVADNFGPEVVRLLKEAHS